MAVGSDAASATSSPFAGEAAAKAVNEDNTLVSHLEHSAEGTVNQMGFLTVSASGGGTADLDAFDEKQESISPGSSPLPDHGFQSEGMWQVRLS